MSETDEAAYKKLEYEKWFEKSKQCRLRLTTMRCLIRGIEYCSMDNCPLHYWMPK